MPLQKPRIALNAHLLNLRGNYRSAGINWYIFHLLQEFETCNEFEFTVFLSDARARELFHRLHLIASRLPTHRPLIRIVWEQFLQPAALRASRADLYHALAFAGPKLISIPWIVTVYDLSFMKFPQSFNSANRLYLTAAIRDALRRADRAIAISESTRRDLIHYFRIAPAKVSVVYCGVEPSFTPAPASEQFRVKHALPEKYILFLGTIEPRKNVSRLIRAFGRAKRAAKLPHQLVLVGAYGWKYAEIKTVAQSAGVADDVIFTGYVPQEDVPDFYRSADVFVYPSFYEGFGLPPLEAMACGTPVIASNVSSLPEVVGGAALMVAPDDDKALTDAIVRAVTDRSLRHEMRERGIVQARRFSWARSAQETAAVYHEVLGV